MIPIMHHSYLNNTRNHHDIYQTSDYTTRHYHHTIILTSKPVIKYLVVLKRGGGVVGDLDAGRQPVEDAVAPQHRVRLRGDQHTGLRVAEYVVLF